MGTWGNLLRQAAEIGLKALTQATKQRDRRRSTSSSRSRPSRTGTSRAGARPRPPTGGSRTAPARERARRIAYAPDLDGSADPGEIVWTWVPYEEDHSVGKDRPVLVVGRDGDWLLGLMLTSKDHDRDARQEARADRKSVV